MINLNMASITEFSGFLESVPVINIISLSRLIDGGAAIFVMINRNHSKARLGATINRFLVRIILRV